MKRMSWKPKLWRQKADDETFCSSRDKDGCCKLICSRLQGCHFQWTFSCTDDGCQSGAKMVCMPPCVSSSCVHRESSGKAPSALEQNDPCNPGIDLQKWLMQHVKIRVSTEFFCLLCCLRPTSDACLNLAIKFTDLLRHLESIAQWNGCSKPKDSVGDLQHYLHNLGPR